MRTLVFVVLCAGIFPVAAAEHDHAGHGQASQAAGRPAASDATTWADLPLIETVPGRDRAAATFRLHNLTAATVTAYAPGERAPFLEGIRFKTEQLQWPLAVQDGHFTLQSSGVGNYHWLQAREETPDSVKVASTAHYFSNPGPAPTEMLAQPKSELEIVPAPLPREHNQYREQQERVFMLRFRGKPLVGTTLRLLSDGGSQAHYRSDSAGRVRVHFPSAVDAVGKPNSHGGHRRPASNRFVLAVEHTEQGRHYLTAFNYRYGEQAYTHRSVVWGGSFLALGGLLGLPLILRRKESPHA